MPRKPARILSPKQQVARLKRIATLADRRRTVEGPGTNHGVGWGDPYTDREAVVAPDANGSKNFSPWAYQVPRKPGAE